MKIPERIIFENGHIEVVYMEADDECIGRSIYGIEDAARRNKEEPDDV